MHMFHIMFALLTDYRIAVERCTAKRRIDITLETKDTIHVMEQKFNKTAQEALARSMLSVRRRSSSYGTRML